MKKPPKPVTVVIGEDAVIVVPKCRDDLGPKATGTFRFYTPDRPMVWKLGRILGRNPSGQLLVETVDVVGATG